MRKEKQRNVLFTNPEVEDSCMAWANRVNERYLQRQRPNESIRERADVVGQYAADDSDLPEIFFRPDTEEAEVET